MQKSKDELASAVYRYETFFKRPFPSTPIRDVGEGRLLRQDLLDRINNALIRQQEDPEWAEMRPAEGTIEDLLYYQPRLRQLMNHLGIH